VSGGFVRYGDTPDADLAERGADILARRLRVQRSLSEETCWILWEALDGTFARTELSVPAAERRGPFEHGDDVVPLPERNDQAMVEALAWLRMQKRNRRGTPDREKPVGATIRRMLAVLGRSR
jgi:hypothetical protein